MINHDPVAAAAPARGERIAQLVFQRVEQASFVEVDELPRPSAATGGHGRPAARALTRTGRGTHGTVRTGRTRRTNVVAARPSAGRNAPTLQARRHAAVGDRVRARSRAHDGPYDERDAPDDEVDAGRPRRAAGAGNRRSRDPRSRSTRRSRSSRATLAGPDGTMQLGVFAAPRNEGIWDEVRAEIADVA